MCTFVSGTCIHMQVLEWISHVRYALDLTFVYMLTGVVAQVSVVESGMVTQQVIGAFRVPLAP